MKRLRDIEADERAERIAAGEWARANADAFKVVDKERTRIGKSRASVRTLLLNEEALNRDVSYAEADLFIPLTGLPAREWTLELEAKVQRVERALKRLPRRQRRLLLDHYVGGMTLEELRTGSESRQAVHGRVTRAKARFIREWKELA